MLLPADPDRANLIFSFTDLGETSLYCLVDRIDPDSGILFHVPVGQAGDQFVILLGGGHDSTRLEIDDNGFGTLGSAIDADVKHTKQNPAIERA
jgi:hypothetical protein